MAGLQSFFPREVELRLYGLPDEIFPACFLLLQHMLYRIRYQASLHQRNQNVNNPRVAMRVMDGDFLTFFVWSEFSGNLFIFSVLF